MSPPCTHFVAYMLFIYLFKVTNHTINSILLSSKFFQYFSFFLKNIMIFSYINKFVCSSNPQESPEVQEIPFDRLRASTVVTVCDDDICQIFDVLRSIVHDYRQPGFLQGTDIIFRIPHHDGL